jgi:K+-sensing histidine kinase KdpD
MNYKKTSRYQEKQVRLLKSIADLLKFSKLYQDLGLKPAVWQNVKQTLLLALSHLDISKLSRRLNLDGLEIYTDPLFENVFFTLAQNVVVHGKTATELAVWYYETPDALIPVFENNGAGIPADMKEKIFERQYEERKGMGLFLAREILSITGITIKETGEPGTGAPDLR